MSVDRQFQLVYLLLERGRMTAGELAEKLEVSPRTVLRDIDALSAAGVPVYTTQGAGGGVALMEGYVLDRAALTDGERQQLLTALAALPGQEGAAALTKLSALFGRQETGWLQVHLSRWGAPDEDDETFRQLKDAILDRHALKFLYASSKGQTTPRHVLPARLVYKGQAWYLQAFDLIQEDYRTFRLTRILPPIEDGEPFRRKLSPPDIEPEGDIPPLFRVEAKLRFSPAAAYRVYDEFGRESITALPDGSLLVDAVFPEDRWLYGYLLSFGPEVTVLSPDTLRKRLAELAKNIYKSHGET